ncbi:Copper chaperone domain-containing protein [Dioscorea alata]|uniref:Copper chaperone domain-containing protein n=1 Tax=Dioscorea alata TaxID=55571 RepID=A0ACB7U000_DIOAL|nr:Copper chaperone domain-containing protein [Dioscorea alata]
MGEAGKPEETKPEEPKPEEKKEEKVDEKKEETPPPPPPPPSPIVLFVNLHCVGCAKKIQRSILKCRGVEEVEVDMVKNQVTVKGIVDPQVLCSRIEKKTLRKAKVLSPLPPEDGDSAKSEVVVATQVSGINTVELHVNMHCEACAQQLKKKILKMRGVQTVETELKESKVTVTGTMDGEKLEAFIYRRTGKLAKIIPPPPPPPPPEQKEEEKKEEGEKKEEEKAPEEKKEEEKKEEEKKEENTEKKEEENGGEGGGKEAEKGAEVEEEPKKEGDPIIHGSMLPFVFHGDHHDMVKRMMYWTPMYVIEQPPPLLPPPPQIFSDENPNACCIS